MKTPPRFINFGGVFLSGRRNITGTAQQVDKDVALLRCSYKCREKTCDFSRERNRGISMNFSIPQIHSHAILPKTGTGL